METRIDTTVWFINVYRIKFGHGFQSTPGRKMAGSMLDGIALAHPSQVLHQVEDAGVADHDLVYVDHGHCKTSSLQEIPQIANLAKGRHTGVSSAAGFTFEGFLSALLSGQQVPAGTAGIQDLIDADDNPISLKLLTEKPGDVHGSYRDLVDHFVDPGGGKQDPESGQYVGTAGTEGRMTYVVALKSFQETKKIDGIIKTIKPINPIKALVNFTSSSLRYLENT